MIPSEIVSAKMEDYYSSLKEADRIKLSRYLPKADVSDKYRFFSSLIDSALADENYRFAVKLCEDSYSIDLDDVQEFFIVEKIIEAYIGAERYDDAKAACDANYKLFLKNREAITEKLSGNLEKLNFRNRFIDIIVAIDFNYDLADKMLLDYNKNGLLSDEELVYRRNSIKTHRLQRVFDGVYSYRPKNE